MLHRDLKPENVLVSANRLSRSQIENKLNGEIRDSRLPHSRQHVRYAEVIYHDNGVLVRTYIFRRSDGTTAGPYTSVVP